LRDHKLFIQISYEYTLFPLCTKKNLLFCSDRFRTIINIIGDALGASIISHFCKKDLEDKVCPLSTKTHSNNEN